MAQDLMPWSRAFDDPIPLPKGRSIDTLEQAARYIQKLPKAEQSIEEWQTAVETLILAAEDRVPNMLARIAVLRAINAGKPPPPIEPRRKRAKVYRLITKKPGSP